jgi:hypothetical protein
LKNRPSGFGIGELEEIVVKLARAVEDALSSA